MGREPRAAVLESGHSGPEAELHAFLFKKPMDGQRHILILASDDAV